ncbi:amino acid adenylation domain-containing protein [Anaerolineales bacterium HSG24]|nr:amino acid adenylation domain-containing protein [Anaerolineales bacterium HSG24]
MKVIEFLAKLRVLDIKLWADEGRLRYSAPEGTLTAELRADLKQHKTEILAFLQQADAANQTDISPIQTASRDTPLPLSYGQQQLWFLQHLRPDSPAYNIPLTTRLHGQLDIPALEQSLGQIIYRHESLRTSFDITAQQPCQQIHPFTGYQLSVVDSSIADADQFMADDARQPFNLAKGPLFRSKLFRLNPDDYILYFNFHHIIFDGWSMALFCQELSAWYGQYYQPDAKTTPLAKLPIQYADFAEWEREHLQTVGQKTLRYWQEKLAGELPDLQLPTDYTRPAIQKLVGDTYTFTIPQTLTNALKELSQAHNVTLFITLLTAFKILLYRYTGQDDILVGVPSANRDRSELENLIGFFVNSIVYRTDVAGNPTFLELLERVREVTVEAQTYQDMPFGKLVEMVQPGRDLSQQPLFQVMFVLQSPGGEYANTLTLPHVTATTLEMVENKTAKFDLTLEIFETDAGLTGSIEYSTSLFNRDTIERMGGHLHCLLEGIAENPAQPLSELPLLTEFERQQILIEWNDTYVEYPHDKCLHHLFEEQVACTPDKIAVLFQQSTIDNPTTGNRQSTIELTYQELNQKANQLAHYLQKQGVGPETLVGICVERSLEMVIGLFGILKAGGAYVPLDPTYPEERLAFMLADSQTPILLTQNHLVSTLPNHQATTICLDHDWDKIAQESTANPNTTMTADNLAYVIYTSGSTGKPKGVMIIHKGVVNYLSWATQTYPIGDGHGSPVHSSISFDLTITSLFTPLLVGQKAILLPKGDKFSEALSTLPTEHGTFSLVKITPAHLEVMKQLLSKQTAQDWAKSIIIGGEALLSDHVSFWQTHAPNTMLINEYGPTETVVGCCVYQLPQQALTSTVVPIGKPIANTQLYILDQHFNPVPIGVVGELYIGGDGVARGYLNRPKLTAESFVSNPFTDDPDSRLYKTGDLARYLPDGNLEFLGRIDHQVKVRGYRIELGEIEAILNQHPKVQQTVVMVRENRPNDKHLVAYITYNQQLQLVVSELRDYLAKKIPDYMVPCDFVILKQVPLTPNGKIDRNALPSSKTGDLATGSQFEPPQTPTEEILANIWAEILGIERVGRYDNFFELGGHSLLAIQLMSKISTIVDNRLSVKFLFLHPTIAEQAEELQNSQTSQMLVPSSFTTNRKVDLDSPYIQIKSSSLLPQQVEAVALGYIPTGILEAFKNDYDKMMSNWLHENRVTLDAVMETSWGRIGLIILPYLESNLYNNQDSLLKDIVEALMLAKQVGAKSVSLTGLIPSATNYGQDILQITNNRSDELPSISTGHGTTSSAVVLNISRIIEKSERNLATERVGFIGLGSIGLTTLRLMLQCSPHPQTIILCDVYGKIGLLEEIKEELVSAFDFQGEVLITPTKTEIPAELYTATLIVGATNVPDVLDITQIRPGTLIIDDSAPHCFSVPLAIERFQRQADILFTEGGILQSPDFITQTIYYPSKLEQNLSVEDFLGSYLFDPVDITGCVFSSLLSACFELPSTIGIVEAKQAIEHYKLLLELGFQGSKLHCEGYILSPELIEKFRNSGGNITNKNGG